MPGLVRGHEGDPHDQEGQHREGGGLRAATSLRHDLGGAVGMPVAPKPPDVAAERFGEQCERAGEGHLHRTGGTTPAAAMVSVMPCVAATTLRQSRRGSGARIHGSSHPATRNA